MSVHYNELHSFLTNISIPKYGYIIKAVPRKNWSDKHYTFITVTLSNGLHPDNYHEDDEIFYNYKIFCQDYLKEELKNKFPDVRWGVMMNDSGNFDIDFRSGVVIFENKRSLKDLLF